MTATFFILLVFVVNTAVLLLGAAWATARNSPGFAAVVSGKGHLSVLNAKHLAGIGVFLVSYACYRVSPETDISIFEFTWNSEWSFISIVITFIAVVAGFTSAGREKEIIPGHYLPVFSLLTYFLIRILFLFLYEFFFRGVFLFFLIGHTDVVTAIGLNIAVYTLLHCHSSRNEIIGTIPFGLLLCMVTLLQHTVWPAVTIHLALSLSFEIRLVFIKQSSVKSWRL
jgi:Type II CAAX prenyl endopeptidase Rce1-like